MSNESVIINHSASGACAKVLPFGATVSSFVNAEGKEILFVSKLAKLDGSKATRGGIPLVFPQFGQPNKDMPQHGFLRNNYWKPGTPVDGEEECTCDFTLDLKDVVNGRGEGVWKDESTVDCSITLTVKVSADALTTILTVENSGGNAFDYQTLFHTYYQIEDGKALDASVCNVTGLAGYKRFDQLTSIETLQGDEPVAVEAELDCIFSPPEKNRSTLEVEVSTGTSSKVLVHATAAADGEIIPVSVVVWNPFVEKSKKMGDFGDEEYHDMICVEPLVNASEKLETGKKVSFLQKITCL